MRIGQLIKNNESQTEPEPDMQIITIIKMMCI